VSTFAFGANVRSLTTGAGPNTVAITINVGDLVVVMVTCSDADTAVVVSDNGASGGNAYQKVIEWDDTADSERYVMYVTGSALSAIGATKSATQVSVSKTGTGFMNIHASTYTGASAPRCVGGTELWDGSNGAQHFASQSSFVNSTSKTPSADNALIVGYSDSDDTTGSSNSPYTNRGTQGSGIATYDLIQTSATSTAPRCTWSASATGGQIGAIFYPDAAPTPSANLDRDFDPDQRFMAARKW
jgi:hypothetical protein